MPTYTFRNTKTDETFEEIMSISAKEEYLINNPTIVQEIFHSPIPQGDSVRLGFKKPSDGFRDILRTIKKNTKSYRYKNAVNTF